MKRTENPRKVNFGGEVFMRVRLLFGGTLYIDFNGAKIAVSR